MKGKIIKIVSNNFTVLSDKLYECKARGKFRKLNLIPTVGDEVIFDSCQLIIEDILKRKNYLIRPSIANIDQAVIVVSVKQPDLDLYLLDKLLCIIEFSRIEPIICFSKLDLLEDKKEVLSIMNYYKTIGYQVYNNHDEQIKQIFKDKITVFTGQSGAGKSTLLNFIDPTLSLKTDDISLALGRGKHTTRHVELLPLCGGMCADTPGFSSLDLLEMTSADIRDNMIEFNQYKEYCAYRDCMHDKEFDCEIKRQLNVDILSSRYENYLKFLKR